MHLSKKAEYALRATIHLGIAAEVGRITISGAELAETNKLPLKFIERILQELRESGIVETHRGKFGGYSLAKPSSEIGIGQLVRLIDGRLAPICCASENAYQSCTCPDEDHCGLRMVMIDVRNAIANILDRYTVAQVVEVTLRKMRRDGIVPPFSEHAQHPAASEAAKAKRTLPMDFLLAFHKLQPGPRIPMDTIPPENHPVDEAPTDWLEIVRKNVSSLRFGSVHITVHDGRVTQIESIEKTRIVSSRNEGALRPSR